MATPAYQRTWTQALTAGVPGVRIPYVSLADLMGNYIYGIKTFLLANPHFAVVWSASNGVGPADATDHTDRIVSAAAWTPRATTQNASQAWCVLSDGNGGQVLLAWCANTDDDLYVGYSPSGAFGLQATTTWQPIAPDQIDACSNGRVSATTFVGATTSADRVWHGLVSDDGKAYRFTCLRAGAIVGANWCIEDLTPPANVPANVTLTNVFCGCWAAGSTVPSNFFYYYQQATNGVQSRVKVNSVWYVAQGVASTWMFGGGSAVSEYPTQMLLQDSSSYVPWPVIFLAGGDPTLGFLGTPKDFWCSTPTGYVVGDGFGVAYEWWQLGGWLWPNPSGQAPTVA